MTIKFSPDELARLAATVYAGYLAASSHYDYLSTAEMRGRAIEDALAILSEIDDAE